MRWKKIGGGILRLKDGRVIQPGQVFEADENDISPAFRDLVEKIETEKKAKEGKGKRVKKE